MIPALALQQSKGVPRLWLEPCEVERRHSGPSVQQVLRSDYYREILRRFISVLWQPLIMWPVKLSLGQNILGCPIAGMPKAPSPEPVRQDRLTSADSVQLPAVNRILLLSCLYDRVQLTTLDTSWSQCLRLFTHLCCCAVSAMWEASNTRANSRLSCNN